MRVLLSDIKMIEIFRLLTKIALVFSIIAIPVVGNYANSDDVSIMMYDKQMNYESGDELEDDSEDKLFCIISIAVGKSYVNTCDAYRSGINYGHLKKAFAPPQSHC